MKNSGENRQKLMDGIKALVRKIRYAAVEAANFLIQHKKISIPAGAAVLILLIVLVVLGVKGEHKAGSAADQSAGMESDLTSAIPVPDVPLEECSNAEINTLFVNYFTALAGGDTDTVVQLKSYLSDKERISIQEKSKYVESYPHVTCYLKPGPVKDSYVVYVYYEAKFYDIDTLAPGVKSYLVTKNEEDSYWILDGEQDQNIGDYLLAISAQEDVEDLFNKATVKYAEAKDADAALKEFLDTLSDKLKEAVTVELAKAEAPAETEDVSETETQPAETEEAVTEQTPDQAAPQIVAVNDVVNIRSSDSETADKLGKAQIGEQFTLLENRGNGWSKIDYNGKEAFIKTQFLATVDAQSAAASSQEADQPAAQTAASSNGSVTVKETVNIRASASETGKKLGAAYKGEKLELLMKQADGWTKIKYQGQTAYVKSEFLE